MKAEEQSCALICFRLAGAATAQASASGFDVSRLDLWSRRVSKPGSAEPSQKPVSFSRVTEASRIKNADLRSSTEPGSDWSKLRVPLARPKVWAVGKKSESKLLLRGVYA